MNPQTKIAAIWAGVLLSSVTAGYAVPTLQLDVPGGTYNTTDQTTYATTPQFSLVALLNGTLDTSATYYISAAIEPKLDLSTPPPNVGSFTIGGVTYSTANMYWGEPPANVLDTSSGNLPTHDQFPTYYAEIAFHFDGTTTVPSYDTQTGESAKGSLYTYSLLVDTSALLAGYSVHFDLYDEAVQKHTGDYTVDDFAPFSHDAQSGTNTENRVPDSGSTYLLLGVGLVGIILSTRARLAPVKIKR